jgi:hypothetical protein
MTEKIIQFKEWTCKLELGWYEHSGRIALDLIDAENGEPVATCTVNIPDYDLPDGYVIIKDYSENEGMLDALMNAGIVGEPKGWIQTGFVTVPVCKLLI